VLLARGDEVSGCDARASAATRSLEARGVEVVIGAHDPEHVRNQDMLVYTTRLSPAGRREKEAAELAGARVLSKPELLAELIAASETVGIAGTHGKTTTTAMIGHVLAEAGRDPTVLVGDGGSSRISAGRLLVSELDESDTTLPMHRPQVAVVTNVEFDHGDYFDGLEAYRRTFTSFLDGLRSGSLAVTCHDDPWLRDRQVPGRRVTYGFAEDADFRCHEGGRVEHHGRCVAELRLLLPGRHTLQNATAALAATMGLGVDPAVAAAALNTFAGARRRMERLGAWRGAVFYDDYGHHPTEVRVTLAALRELPHRRLVLVLQPHRYSRYRDEEAAFVPSVAGADLVLVTEIYGAGEPNPGGVTSAALARAVGGDFAPDLAAARRWLEREVGEGDLVLLMGAGDIRSLGDELATPL
jgi:UDP-N-acetylmuramate--alanine ligase